VKYKNPTAIAILKITDDKKVNKRIHIQNLVANAGNINRF